MNHLFILSYRHIFLTMFKTIKIQNFTFYNLFYNMVVPLDFISIGRHNYHHINLSLTTITSTCVIFLEKKYYVICKYLLKTNFKKCNIFYS